MAVLVDLQSLQAEGVITPVQAQILRDRARQSMVELVIRLLLCGGVLAAAAGFIAWLNEPVQVALAGLGFLAIGMMVLLASGDLWRMFGHAAALIGALMLAGGGYVESLRSFPQPEAGLLPAAAGLLIALPSAALHALGDRRLTFLAGFLLLTGLALHVTGLGSALVASERGGLIPVLFSLYVTAVALWAGWFLNLRAITALAILPFAQALHVGSGYLEEFVALFTPEPALSILQMALAAGFCLWLLPRVSARTAAHAAVFALMAFILANLSFLNGAFSGDLVGDSLALWRAYDRGADGYSPQEAEAARRLYESRALYISDTTFAVVWALVLAVCAVASARGLQRGLFNATLCFATIHAYTQAFMTFGDQPLAWVAGGLAAIPLAWGIWRLNQQFP